MRIRDHLPAFSSATSPFPSREDGPPLPPAYLNPPETLFQVYCPHGSDWSGEEFACDTGRAAGGRFKNSFFPGESKEWKPSGRAQLLRQLCALF